MIYKFVFVCALISITASASAIKGRGEEAVLEGGLKSPIEQHRLIEQHQNAAKTTTLENNAGLEESRFVYQKREEVPLVAEHRNEENIREQSQQREEVEVKAPSGPRYEAKQQLSRDELSKVNNKLEQREELSKTNHFEQKQEADKFEQFSQQRDIDSSVLENHGYQQQVVELKEEQRRLVDEEPALVRPQLPLTLVEEPLRNENLQHATKGAGYGAAINQAPIGEAEPYAFSYNVDGSSRIESGDTKGVVRGQYTLSGADGMNRVVDYVADHNGFRANVNTNEFGTEAKSPANIALRTSQPLAEEITLRSEKDRTREHLALTNNAIYASKGGFQQKQSWPEENYQTTTLIESEKKQPQQQQQQFVSLEQPSKISQRPLFASKGEPARKVPVGEQSQVPIKQISEHNDGRKIPLEQYQAPLKQIAERNDARKGLEEIKREPIKGLKEQQHQEKSCGSQYCDNAGRVQRLPVKSVAPQLAPIRAAAPGVLVRAYPPPAPVVRGPAPLVYRPHVNQHGRYPPPSPVQGYRRSHRYESVPNNPRVSFYRSELNEDHASFEHPDF